jgi:cation transport regulator ChaC
MVASTGSPVSAMSMNLPTPISLTVYFIAGYPSLIARPAIHLNGQNEMTLRTTRRGALTVVTGK